MESLQKELVKLKDEGCEIWFADNTCTGDSYFTGKVLEVGTDCAIIAVNDKGKKLYNINQIIWLQKGR